MSTLPPPRRDVSRRRYAARRLAVAALLLLVGFVAIKGLASFGGGDDGNADADALPTTTDGSTGGQANDDANNEVNGAAGGAGSEAEAAAPVTTIADTTTSEVTTTTRPERVGPPSQSEPALVLIVGDSDAGTFGPYLEILLDATRIVETELDYKVSSGLARPDFYDWPEAMRERVPAIDPDIVVVTFGGNDAQGLTVPGDGIDFIVGDPVDNEAEWTEEYQRRAGEVMDLLLEDDRAVIWVGIPNDDNPEVTARMSIQDRAAKAAAEERPDVVFIDTWSRFSGRDGNWAEFVIDPRDGQGKDVRAGDGFHLNVDGAEILAIDIAQAVRDELRALGASI